MESSRLGLQVGKELTPEQISGLSKDLIWYVTQNVNGVEVLVPKIYLSKDTLATITADGRNKIGGVNGTYIKTDNFVNNGMKIGNGGVTYVQANTVKNETATNLLSEITGDKTFIQSIGNIENIGGKISGNEAVVLISDNGKVINDTTKRSVGYYNSEFDRTKHEEVKSLGTISSNGTVFVKANSYESTGGMLSTDHLALDVNKINLNALSLSGEDKFGSGGSNFSRYAETTHLGAGVSANSASGTVGDMNLKGSSFIAKDTTGLTVTGNVNAESVVNSYENESKSTSKGFMSSKSSYKNSHAEENSASNLMLGENAVILGDVNSIGSNVVLGDNTYIGGKLTTDAQQLHNSYFEENKKKGFSGGISHGTASLSYGKSQNSYDEKSTINAGSNLQIGDGSVLNKGAEITAINFEYGNIQINNGDVKYGARIDTQDVRTTSKSSNFGVSIGINSPALDRAKQVANAVSQNRGGDIAGGLMTATNAVTGTISGLAGNQGNRQSRYDENGSVGRKGVIDAQTNNNFYANIGVNAGFSRSKNETNSHTENAVVTTMTLMNPNSSITYNNVKNITYQGTQAENGTFIYNNVENITKEAVELHNKYSSNSSSMGINTGATIGYGHKTQIIGNGGSISASRSNQNTNEIINQNGKFQNVNEVHNNTGTMILDGFNQEGGKVTGNINKFVETSRQNTSTTTGSSRGASIGISSSGVPNSVNVNASRTNGNRSFVDNQSSFIVGEGSNLHIGTFENTAGIVGKEGNSKLTIDKYIGHDLQNNDEMNTVGGSMGVSIGNTTRLSNIGINTENRDKQGITRNSVIGDVEIGQASGDPINRDKAKANEVTKDTHSSTNINVESQTIEYATNPAKFKEDVAKAKQEIDEVKRAFNESINDRGDDNRNFFGQLSEARLTETIDNIAGSRLERATTDNQIAGAFKDAYRDLGYDNVDILFSDPKNAPQLIDKDGKPKAGTAFVSDETGRRTIIINAEAAVNHTRAGLIGTITEEGSHIIGAVEGRQLVTGTDEKGLESTGKASNAYLTEKYGKNDEDIAIKSEKKDLNGIDFGRNVGDDVIVGITSQQEIKFDNAKKQKKVIQTFIDAYGGTSKDYKVDWNSYLIDPMYRIKINYYNYVAENSIKDIKEFKNNKNSFKKVNDSEAVFHNIVGNKIRIRGNLNRKYVDNKTGKEVVLDSKEKRVIRDPVNIGTYNYYTYQGDSLLQILLSPFDKASHIIDINNWVAFGTGINDRTTQKWREKMLTLGTAISLDYQNIRAWAESKNIYDIGEEELERYNRDKTIKLGRDIMNETEKRLRKAGIIK